MFFVKPFVMAPRSIFSLDLGPFNSLEYGPSFCFLFFCSFFFSFLFFVLAQFSEKW